MLCLTNPSHDKYFGLLCLQQGDSAKKNCNSRQIQTNQTFAGMTHNLQRVYLNKKYIKKWSLGGDLFLCFN